MNIEEKNHLLDTYRGLWSDAVGHMNPQKVEDKLCAIISEKYDLPVPDIDLLTDTSFHASHSYVQKPEHKFLIEHKNTVALEVLRDWYRRRWSEDDYESRKASGSKPSIRVSPLRSQPLPPVLQSMMSGLEKLGANRTVGQENLYRELILEEIFIEKVQPHLLSSDEWLTVGAAKENYAVYTNQAG